MKAASRILFVVGIACILLGIGSCIHFYRTNPPPEASKPGWDGDAQVEPYVAQQKFVVLTLAGISALVIAKYLRGRNRVGGAQGDLETKQGMSREKPPDEKEGNG